MIPDRVRPPLIAMVLLLLFFCEEGHFPVVRDKLTIRVITQ